MLYGMRDERDSRGRSHRYRSVHRGHRIVALHLGAGRLQTLCCLGIVGGREGLSRFLRERQCHGSCVLVGLKIDILILACLEYDGVQTC